MFRTLLVAGALCVPAVAAAAPTFPVTLVGEYCTGFGACLPLDLTLFEDGTLTSTLGIGGEWSYNRRAKRLDGVLADGTEGSLFRTGRCFAGEWSSPGLDAGSYEGCAD
jgi:hypothetical protein